MNRLIADDLMRELESALCTAMAAAGDDPAVKSKVTFSVGFETDAETGILVATADIKHGQGVKRAVYVRDGQLRLSLLPSAGGVS